MDTSPRARRHSPSAGTAGNSTKRTIRQRTFQIRPPMWFEAAIAVAAAALVASGCGASSQASTASAPTTTTTAVEAPPVLSPIKAVFDQPAFTTHYTEDANATTGATYNWTASIPIDPGCASGFKPGTPQQDSATWNHSDVPDGGPCIHNGDTFGPSGHHGTVTVTVTTTHWRCTATYEGTATGTGPAPPPCVQT